MRTIKLIYCFQLLKEIDTTHNVMKDDDTSPSKKFKEKNDRIGGRFPAEIWTLLIFSIIP